MAPLVVLVVVTSVLLVASAGGVRRLRPWVVPLRCGLAAMFVLTGMSHFVGMRADLISMVPPALPAPGLLVTLTGMLELAGALGLLLPRTRPWAAGGLAALLVAMFPANVYAATKGLVIDDAAAMPLIPRTLIQLVYLSATVAVLIVHLRAQAGKTGLPAPNHPYPVPHPEVKTMSTTLEQSIPEPQFGNRHSRWIDAQPEQVWEALTAITLSELSITRLLVALRYLGRPQQPEMTLFQGAPITMLEVTPLHYALGGAVARPWKRMPDRQPIHSVDEFVDFDEPGWVKYLTDFSVTAEQGGTRLRTETRGYCTDAYAWNRFRYYWAAIRVGSGLVRRDMLRSVARKAHLDSRAASGS